MKINSYVKKNWETLPKSKFDDLEVVIVKEIRNSEEGWGHHSYEGLGVTKDGKFLWLFSSGCSCSGGPSSEDASMKSLVIDGSDMQDLKWDAIDFDKLQVSFSTY